MLLSSIVVNAETGKPGHGLFELIRSYGWAEKHEDEDAVVKREQQRVYQWGSGGGRPERLSPEARERARQTARRHRQRRSRT